MPGITVASVYMTRHREVNILLILTYVALNIALGCRHYHHLHCNCGIVRLSDLPWVMKLRFDPRPQVPSKLVPPVEHFRIKFLKCG